MSSNPQTSVKYVLSRRVSEYADYDVLILTGKTKVALASRIMHKQQEDDIIVTDLQGNPVGIVTDRDILLNIGDACIDPQTTRLENIMSSPLVTIEPNATLKEALTKMRDYKIRKLAVISNKKVTGIILQTTIASALRNATVVHPRFLSTPVRAIIGNLGFVLQFSGLLIVVPALVATALNESTSAAGIYLTSVMLMATGFFLNSYGEKASLNLRQASVLVLSSFFLLIMYGTIPYYYLGVYSSYPPADQFANSFFSSAAGFTTSGLAFIDQPENFPQSFIFYRSFTQFIGGMSFIYLVMTAFYPEGKLRTMRGFISGKTLRLRELFGTIIIIFAIYTIIMAFLLYFFGERNLVDNFSLAMSTLSSGGYIPHSGILDDLLWQEYLIIIAGMILAALPFTFHYVFVRQKFMTVKLGTEVSIYFGILIIGTTLFIYASGLDLLDGAFYAVSASTTTGFQFDTIRVFSDHAKTILIVLMFIGGCGFSTAGGIKVYRLINLKIIRNLVSKARRTGVSSDDKKELASTIIILALFPLVTFVVSTHLAGYGQEPINSFFDATAAVTNGGLSAGVITTDLEASTKFMLGLIMILGRFEIIAIIYVIVPRLMA